MVKWANLLLPQPSLEFWGNLDLSWACPTAWDVIQLIEQVHGKQMVTFGTLGAYPDSDHDKGVSA